MRFSTFIGFVALSTGIGLAFDGLAQSFLTNGLVAYYPLNGNASDASGNGNDGIFVPATAASSGPVLTTNHLGVANAAFSFNSGSYVYASVVGLPLGNSARTVSGWMKLNPSSDSAEETVASWGYGDNTESTCTGAAFALWANFTAVGNGRNLYSWGSFNDVDAPYNFDFNTYYFVADTYDGQGSVTLFINGAAVAAKKIGSYNTFTNNYLLRMGASTHAPSWNNDYFDGSLDNVRVYNRCLSTNEIVELYTVESVPFTNALAVTPPVNIHKAIYVTSSDLSAGANYQLQLSTDLKNWTNAGAFTAPYSTWRSSAYWDVEDWNNIFFRLSLSK